MNNYGSERKPFVPPSEMRRRTLGTPIKPDPDRPQKRKEQQEPTEDPNAPLIPFDVIDAPSQRLCVTAFYACLWAWRIYDVYAISRADGESLWLFFKWLVIDSIFLFTLPALRIPWMDWPPFVTFGLFLLHAALNAMFMFQTGLPFASWFIAASKAIWGRELGLSDRRINPQDLLFNSSLILGKQTIHILPEGYERYSIHICHRIPVSCANRSSLLVLLS